MKKGASTSARVTMKDVAWASGVSPATVSFVLNGTPGQVVRDSTRDRVRQAAADLGYVPHAHARALREGASRVVVLDIGSLPGRSSLESFIAGMGAELSLLGHVLFVHHGEQDELRDVVGAITPRAVIDVTRPFRRVGSDDSDGGAAFGVMAHTRTQLGYLIARGHRALAFASPASFRDDKVRSLADARRAQAHAVAAQAGVALVDLVLGSELSDATAAVADLRGEHPEVTAVAALDDPTAFAVLGGMFELGLTAPGDLAIIGFEDSEAGAWWQPALTSVRIDAAAYGRRAARVALGAVDEQWPDTPSSVVVRRSA